MGGTIEHALGVSEQPFPQRLFARVVAETKTRECSCQLHADMTREELVALGGGCTEPNCICPRLAKVRRRVGL